VVGRTRNAKENQMKVTRIDIEGPNGTATLTRDGRCIHITGERLVKAIETAGGKACLVKKLFRLLADAWGQNENHNVARDLQQHLDGYVGTMGDVAAYRRVIDMLAD
jgi:Mg2+ and Co2+ transporter CorA